jgi:NAD(P)H-hydrate epimerase
MVRRLLPRRKADAHKGDFGRALVVAGSVGMAGAAVLCASAALRSGAGLVRVCVPEELFPVIHIGVPEATCIERRHNGKGSFCAVDRSSAEHVSDDAFALLEGENRGDDPFGIPDLSAYDAVAAGSGLGTDVEAAGIVKYILNGYDGKLVLDADALNIIAELREAGSYEDAGVARLSEVSRVMTLRPDGGAARIITPHPGEAGRLLGVSAAEVNADRSGAARTLAKTYGAVALLKGRNTVIAIPYATGGRSHEGIAIYTNPTGNPGMATAGSGDVLTGLILALLSQGLGAAEAAIAGAYLHGLAGDMASEEKGTYGLIASDIREAIPYAIKSVMA